MTIPIKFMDIVARLNMTAHPEGGYFTETYRSAETMDLRDRGRRAWGTSIYFLMPRGQISKLHRLTSDEIWHYHQGDTITVLIITSNGQLQKHLVGPIQSGEERPQVIIPKGSWFGAIHEGQPHNGYTLVGCTVSPGFDFADFELAKRESLLKAFPKASSETREWILKLSD